MLVLSWRNPVEGKGRALVALAMFLLLPAVASGQTWSWENESVDSSGRFASLAVDKLGNLHLSYAKDHEGIKYGFRPAASSQWFTMVLDRQIVSYTNLTLDRQGNPHICYTPRVIRYAYWDGQKWQTQQIAPGSGVIGFSCSVAVDPDGTPHVVWYQEKNPDGSFAVSLKYATLREGVWMARTIEFRGQTGKWNAMVLDAQGYPHISYSAYTKGDLKYARWNGKSWVATTVDARNLRLYRGMGNSLALDANGRALISYYDETSLKFAREGENTWSIESLIPVSPESSWKAFRSSLVMDQRGFPHICYEDFGALKHAYWDGNQWRIQVIAARGTEPHRYNALAIDGKDTLYVAYRDPVDGSLKVAIGRQTPRPPTHLAEKK